MLNNIEDVIKFRAQSVEKMHDQNPVSDRRIDIGKEIGESLQLLTVIMHREVADLKLA